MTTSEQAIAGVVLIALTGFIHLVEAPEHLEEETYIGVLFLLNAAGAALGAFWLLRGPRRNGWLIGIIADREQMPDVRALVGWMDDELEALAAAEPAAA